VLFRSSCSYQDECWVWGHLNQKQWTLFRAMLPCDQAHCVRTARRAEELSLTYGVSEEERGLLVRAALLHDIGKGGAELGFAVRVLQRLPFSREVKRRMARIWPHGESALRVLEDHPGIGGEKLRRMGACRRLIGLVAEHHCPTTKLGEILKRADDG